MAATGKKSTSKYLTRWTHTSITHRHQVVTANIDVELPRKRPGLSSSSATVEEAKRERRIVPMVLVKLHPTNLDCTHGRLDARDTIIIIICEGCPVPSRPLAMDNDDDDGWHG